ncbi:MAG: hypothetical protein N3H30_01350, partial [Candidatus Micrarchaeota archaeon]|nr:hypothetical protein [Candidatus Micrarchaeota archaeon]
LVIGFAMVLIFALIYAIYPALSNFNRYSEVSQAERSLSRLAGAFEAASAYGAGTETTLYLYFPPGNLSYAKDTGHLVYTLPDGTSLVRITALKGLVQLKKGDKNADAVAFEGAGVRSIRVSKSVDAVEVSVLQ